MGLEFKGNEKNVFDRHYIKCDFDDECSVCNNPTNGSYATGYDNWTGEVDDYICGDCAMKTLSGLQEAENQEYIAIEKACGRIK